jgi:hypothetical protein
MEPETLAYGRVKCDVIGVSRAMSSTSQQYVKNVEFDDQMYIEARDSRIGVNSKMGDTVSAQIEFDLYGAAMSGTFTDDNGDEVDVALSPASNKASLLLRHAYAKVDLGSGLSLLVGQTWDVFAPGLPSVLNYGWLWNGGNAGYRRPQVRFEHEAECGIVTRIAAARAVDNEISASADLQGRLAYEYKEDGKAFTLGVSGVQGSVDEDKNVERLGTAVDLVLDFGTFYVKGEFIPWGSNLKPYLAGVGQDTVTHGGWAMIGVKLSDKARLNIGWSTDDPANDELPALVAAGDSNILRNTVAFINLECSINSNTTIGTEVASFVTRYDEFGTGVRDYDSVVSSVSLIHNF